MHDNDLRSVLDQIPVGIMANYTIKLPTRALLLIGLVPAQSRGERYLIDIQMDNYWRINKSTI